MENIVMLIVGAVLVIVGIVNIRGNISTIHAYNRRRVREEDVPKYGRAVGTGTVIIGAAVVLDYLCMVLEWEALVPALTAVGIFVGMGFILYGQMKYNKGIF